MQFTAVEKKENLSKEAFKDQYLDPLKPVIFKDLSKDWVAREKWTFDFFEKEYGDITVPIFDPDNYFRSGKHYMKSYFRLLFGDYLKLIQSTPTNLRLHIFQIMKEAPELTKDFETPEIMSDFLKKFPAMFFGGKGATLRLHYDLDCSHVFLTHFQTRKEIFLFPYEQRSFLYHLPYTVQAEVDIMNPDYRKYPALKNANGYHAILEHGETLFIPRRYWHCVHYCEPGFSLSVRSNDSIRYTLLGLWNIGRHFIIDKGMNQFFGERWLAWKSKRAFEKANKWKLKSNVA
ncbi:cupin-like domain-containing protein [Robertkochia solimangrovi]|uniref:cupin-like domain-containing protein n=1 Tax=Robertkochia solimangrovi TaxID=2213046 RepID=UPI00117BF5F0|nr:cupin-like domain-containing protein [Robertkochia solimangrovi]TRZ41629.1 cupin-like domain-containing protein [Robertkochia solimangrovi]